ncbi:MAG: dienelactone hydrolase family protein [Anaerolineales bacterium]|nr:dienelactone hydrolase family protein [Anaerolineales bacterium]
MSIQTSEIQLKVNDKTVNAYLAAPQNGGPGVLVLHAWWGLKPFFKQVCDQLAEQGFTAFAPDLYQGRVAKTIDEAKEFMEQNDFEFMSEIVKAANAHLTSLCAGKIGVVGFSMGSGWALAVAENNPNVSAAVLFYGAGEADFSKVKAKVLGHFAEVDEWEPLEYVQGMEAGMKSAGLDVTLHLYPKVAHWFVEEDRPEYDSASALLAWSRTYEFLRKNL